MKQVHILTIAVLTAVFMFSACKTRRNGTETVRIKGMTKTEILERNKKVHLDFKTIAFKGKAEFEGTQNGKETNVGFSYRINIAKDSLIWATISKFGIPAATILMDQDSVKIKISLNRSAILCDFSVVSEMVGMDVNFGLVQSFFTGDPSFQSGNLELMTDNPQVIHFKESRPPYQVSWFLNASHFKLDKMVAKDPNLERESSVLYEDFKTVNGQKVPGSAKIAVTSAQPARIELIHSSIELEPAKTNFKLRIPGSYDIQSCKFK